MSNLQEGGEVYIKGGELEISIHKMTLYEGICVDFLQQGGKLMKKMLFKQSGENFWILSVKKSNFKPFLVWKGKTPGGVARIWTSRGGEWILDLQGEGDPPPCSIPCVHVFSPFPSQAKNEGDIKGRGGKKGRRSASL